MLCCKREKRSPIVEFMLRGPLVPQGICMVIRPPLQSFGAKLRLILLTTTIQPLVKGFQ